MKQKPLWQEPCEQRLIFLIERCFERGEIQNLENCFLQASRVLSFLQKVMEDDTSPPSIVSFSDSGFQIEWHQNGFDVEIAFSGEEEDETLYVQTNQQEIEYAGPKTAFEKLGLAKKLKP